MTRRFSQRSAAIAGFALAVAAIPLAMLTSSPAEITDQADCPVGWTWDVDLNECVNVPNPVLGPAGPVGVGGVVGPVGVDPVLGPAGPVGVGGVVGPVGVDPVLGPAGPVGVGRR